MTLPPILTQVGPYPVTYIPASPANVWQTDDGLPKEMVVCHIAEGTLQGCDDWFRNPVSQASANFVVGLNGEIHQYVPLYGKAPYANGVAHSDAAKVARMDATVKMLSERYNWVSQNKWTWSIEHAGRSGNALTPEQFDASTRLTAMLLGSLPPGQRRTGGHYMFDAIDRAHCPGWDTQQWNEYDARWAQLIGGGPVADFDFTKIKPIMDAGYTSALQAKQAADESFKKWQELFEEIRRQVPGAV